MGTLVHSFPWTEASAGDGQGGGRSLFAWLAAERQVAPSTHRQALSALLFLYRAVLGLELSWMDEIGRPKQRERVPTVLSHEEVQALLALMAGQEAVLGSLLYGTGLRLMEGVRLRVKDIDFARNEIIVREGKGGQGSTSDAAAVLEACVA